MEENIKAYLKEIAEVSKRHKLFIYACSCCGSVTDGNNKNLAEGNIRYDLEEDTYTVE